MSKPNTSLLDAAKHALQWFKDFDEPKRCETEREWLEQAIKREEEIQAT